MWWDQAFPKVIIAQIGNNCRIGQWWGNWFISFLCFQSEMTAYQTVWEEELAILHEIKMNRISELDNIAVNSVHFT